MELSWKHQRCIVCLRDDVAMTPLAPRARVARRLRLVADTSAPSATTDSVRVSSPALKHDPTIRYAIEDALASELPDLARGFAEGQPYFVPSDQGPLAARYREGAIELGTTQLNDGSLIQDRDRAAQTIETVLERTGADAAERKAKDRRRVRAPWCARLAARLARRPSRGS